MQMADEVQLIPLTQVDIYGGTQTRVSTNEDAVASYAEEMAAGSVFRLLLYTMMVQSIG